MEMPETGFGGANKSNSSPIDPGDVGNDAGAGFSSVKCWTKHITVGTVRE